MFPDWPNSVTPSGQTRELDVYSGELKDLAFDWDDIRQVRSARRLDLLLERREGDDESAKNAGSRGLPRPFRKLAVRGDVLSGLVTSTPEEIRVVDGVPLTIAPRDRLQSLS